jgi:hypothetical protein
MDEDEELLLVMIETLYERKYQISQSRSKAAIESLKKCIDISYNAKVTE